MDIVLFDSGNHAEVIMNIIDSANKQTVLGYSAPYIKNKNLSVWR